MDKSKLKGQLPHSLLSISEKCIAGAIALTGIAAGGQTALAALPTTDIATTTHTSPSTPTAPNMSSGAILLSVMQRDPATGEEVAAHYSHASHSSHASHASHYSSRP